MNSRRQLVIAMVRTSEKELKKNFPNLYREIEEVKPIAQSEEDELLDPDPEPTPKNMNVKKLKVDRGRGYDPSVMDFLQRCSTNDQAVEIIAYLEKRGEITNACAESLRKKVKDKGVRAFGLKREPGYYHKAFD
jgi:hypothetical protein